MLSLSSGGARMFGDGTGSRVLVGRWIGPGHDGPLLRSTGGGDGAGDSRGPRTGQLASLTDSYGGGMADERGICMLGRANRLGNQSAT